MAVYALLTPTTPHTPAPDRVNADIASGPAPTAALDAPPERCPNATHAPTPATPPTHVNPTSSVNLNIACPEPPSRDQHPGRPVLSELASKQYKQSRDYRQ